MGLLGCKGCKGWTTCGWFVYIPPPPPPPPSPPPSLSDSVPATLLRPSTEPPSRSESQLSVCLFRSLRAKADWRRDARWSGGFHRQEPLPSVLGGFTTGFCDRDSGWASTRTMLPLRSNPPPKSTRHTRYSNVYDLSLTVIVIRCNSITGFQKIKVCPIILIKSLFFILTTSNSFCKIKPGERLEDPLWELFCVYVFTNVLGLHENHVNTMFCILLRFRNIYAALFEMNLSCDFVRHVR